MMILDIISSWALLQIIRVKRCSLFSNAKFRALFQLATCRASLWEIYDAFMGLARNELFAPFLFSRLESSTFDIWSLFPLLFRVPSPSVLRVRWAFGDTIVVLYDTGGWHFKFNLNAVLCRHHHHHRRRRRRRRRHCRRRRRRRPSAWAELH